MHVLTLHRASSEDCGSPEEVRCFCYAPNAGGSSAIPLHSASYLDIRGLHAGADDGREAFGADQEGAVQVPNAHPSCANAWTYWIHHVRHICAWR